MVSFHTFPKDDTRFLSSIDYDKYVYCIQLNDSDAIPTNESIQKFLETYVVLRSSPNKKANRIRLNNVTTISESLLLMNSSGESHSSDSNDTDDVVDQEPYTQLYKLAICNDGSACASSEKDAHHKETILQEHGLHTIPTVFGSYSLRGFIIVVWEITQVNTREYRHPPFLSFTMAKKLKERLFESILQSNILILQLNEKLETCTKIATAVKVHGCLEFLSKIPADQYRRIRADISCTKGLLVLFTRFINLILILYSCSWKILTAEVDFSLTTPEGLMAIGEGVSPAYEQLREIGSSIPGKLSNQIASMSALMTAIYSLWTDYSVLKRAVHVLQTTKSRIEGISTYDMTPTVEQDSVFLNDFYIQILTNELLHSNPSLIRNSGERGKFTAGGVEGLDCQLQEKIDGTFRGKVMIGKFLLTYLQLFFSYAMTISLMPFRHEISHRYYEVAGELLSLCCLYRDFFIPPLSTMLSSRVKIDLFTELCTTCLEPADSLEALPLGCYVDTLFTHENIEYIDRYTSEAKKPPLCCSTIMHC